MYYVYCSLILTFVIQLNILAPYICKYIYLSVGGAVGAGELKVSLLMLYTKQSFKLVCNKKLLNKSC